MKAFYPGKEWLDTDGKPIQAHGGQVIFENGRYYWYGENKELSVSGSDIWHSGIRCYSSENLYDWKDEGIILAPSDDIQSPLHPTRIIDRPHILLNRKNGTYVMWIKLAGTQENPRDWGSQHAGIAVSDRLTGPYRFVREFLPNGLNMGDFDFIRASDTDEVYLYFSRIENGNPADMVCMRLTEDYMDVTAGYSSHFPYEAPPETRESPAFFRRNGHLYLSTSGCTGYHPNPSVIAVADDCQGPWQELGDICVGDTTKSTFHSQISCIFKHPQKQDLYIAIGDRWLYDLDLTKLPWITEGYRILQAKHPIDTDLTWEEVRKYSKRDMSRACYVWLPLRFDGARPYITWEDCWSWEDFK